jgi:hypothetical protein
LSVQACAANNDFWLKHWRFGPMLGSARAVAGMKGVHADYIELGRDRIDHPLGDGVCTDRVDYSDLKHRTRAALARDVGALWRFPAAVDQPGSVSGWIKCGGAHAAAVAFVNPRQGYLFFEDGLIITLR